MKLLIALAIVGTPVILPAQEVPSETIDTASPSTEDMARQLGGHLLLELFNRVTDGKKTPAVEPDPVETASSYDEPVTDTATTEPEKR